jgi:hypothetical protein
VEEKDFLDDLLTSFRSRNSERARPDYDIKNEIVLGTPINEARQRYLDAIAEHQRRRAGLDDKTED